jgi:hypothetical protein
VTRNPFVPHWNFLLVPQGKGCKALGQEKEMGLVALVYV